MDPSLFPHYVHPPIGHRLPMQEIPQCPTFYPPPVFQPHLIQPRFRPILTPPDEMYLRRIANEIATELCTLGTTNNRPPPPPSTFSFPPQPQLPSNYQPSSIHQQPFYPPQPTQPSLYLPVNLPPPPTRMRPVLGRSYSDLQNEGTSEPQQTTFLRQKKQFCALCHNNKEPKYVYRSHDLKDAEGIVVCPVLRSFVCRFCGATGDFAHTDSYCPTRPQTQGNRVNSVAYLKTRLLSNGQPRK